MTSAPVRVIGIADHLPRRRPPLPARHLHAFRRRTWPHLLLTLGALLLLIGLTSWSLGGLGVALLGLLVGWRGLGRLPGRGEGWWA